MTVENESRDNQKWKDTAAQGTVENPVRAAELARLRTELEQTRARLVSAARRASVASLAQGLAHEINNALTPIIGQAQILALQAAQGGAPHPDAQERAEQIIVHAKRIAALTASLRRFTRGGGETAMAFSLGGILQDALELERERCERLRIRVHTQLDAGNAVLEGHPDQIQEIIMNVLQNALEALPRGGDLYIQTRRAGARVAVEIRDNGVGIRAEDLPNVFEAGFTTKGVQGQPSGLGWGLFTARALADAHGGEIQIESTPQQGESDAHGTTVHILLPVSLWTEVEDPVRAEP